MRKSNFHLFSVDSFPWLVKKNGNIFCPFIGVMDLPFGMPHGPFVRVLSKKSRSYFRAGGYVNATCALINGEQLKTSTVSTNVKCAISLYLYMFLCCFFMSWHDVRCSLRELCTWDASLVILRCREVYSSIECIIGAFKRRTVISNFSRIQRPPRLIKYAATCTRRNVWLK